MYQEYKLWFPGVISTAADAVANASPPATTAADGTTTSCRQECTKGTYFCITRRSKRDYKKMKANRFFDFYLISVLMVCLRLRPSW